MLFNIIMAILPLIIPYTFLGENLSSLVLALVAIIFLLINLKKINPSKKILYPLSLFISLVVLIQVFIIPSSLESFSGLFTYINILLYYLVFTIVIKHKEEILRCMVISLAVICILSILVQGLYFDIRIYGNIGYANSYALLLLVGLYLNKIRKSDKATTPIEIVFILGILYTGSRTTLVLLLPYLLLQLYKTKSINSLEGFIFAFIQYVIYSQLELASLLLMPIIFFTYIYVKDLKIKHVIYKLSIACSIIFTFIGTSNTFERIRNISLSNGSLQERFIYFEDALSNIFSNPLGNGINTFQYNQYMDSSAFYDVKYIHNSILQTTYDLGLIAGLLFILLLLFGGLYIYKRSEEKKTLLLVAYISILLHSLLDFDFSYSTFTILLIILISLSNVNNTNLKPLNKINKKISAFHGLYVLVPIISYLVIFESSLVLSREFALHNAIESSNKTNSFAHSISLNKDSRPLYNLASGYKTLYDDTNNLDNLTNSKTILEEALLINNNDSRILWNLNYIYYKLGNLEKLDSISENLYESQKYNKDFYKIQAEYLKNIYKDDSSYSIKIAELETLYNSSLKSLNPKSKYIKNQL